LKTGASALSRVGAPVCSRIVTVERRDSPPNYERRSQTLALAVGLFIVLRSLSPVFFAGAGRDFQVWMYVASLLALALSLCLCLLLVVPELRARVGPRFQDEPRVFAWAFSLFVLATLVTVVANVEGAIDSLDEDTPFG
jgi:hypothetical protein